MQRLKNILLLTLLVSSTQLFAQLDLLYTPETDTIDPLDRVLNPEKYENTDAVVTPDEDPLAPENKTSDQAAMDLLKEDLKDGLIVTHEILFEPLSPDIKPESMHLLNHIYHIMQQDAALRLQIGVHSDSEGDEETNVQLSQQRANRIKGSLNGMGISSSRLEAIGYGSRLPIDTNATEEGRANNRRVQFMKL